MNIKGADRNGTISYSQVIFNPHPFNDGKHFFVEVVTVNGKAVRMTPNHLLPLCNGGLVTARSLQPGDCVMTADGEEKVAKTTQNVEAGGIYTAVTENEFLVVDGVVASPFALSHGIAHSLFDREDVCAHFMVAHFWGSFAAGTFDKSASDGLRRRLCCVCAFVGG